MAAQSNLPAIMLAGRLSKKVHYGNELSILTTLPY